MIDQNYQDEHPTHDNPENPTYEEFQNEPITSEFSGDARYSAHQQIQSILNSGSALFRPIYSDPAGTRAALNALEISAPLLMKNGTDAKLDLKLLDPGMDMDEILDLELESISEAAIKVLEVALSRINTLSESTKVMLERAEALKAISTEVHSQHSDLLKSADELHVKETEIDQREHLVHKTLHLITLTPKEEALLLASPLSGSGVDMVGLPQAFFQAVSRAKEISQCPIPVGSRLAVDVTQMCHMHLESAYDRMYSWAQSRFQFFGSGAPLGDLPAWKSVWARVCGILYQARPASLNALIQQVATERTNAWHRAFEGWPFFSLQFDFREPGSNYSHHVNAVYQRLFTSLEHEIAMWNDMFRFSEEQAREGPDGLETTISGSKHVDPAFNGLPSSIAHNFAVDLSQSALTPIVELVCGKIEDTLGKISKIILTKTSLTIERSERGQVDIQALNKEIQIVVSPYKVALVLQKWDLALSKLLPIDSGIVASTQEYLDFTSIVIALFRLLRSSLFELELGLTRFAMAL
jgi:hypothetical protein